jgi:hypothetical protein
LDKFGSLKGRFEQMYNDGSKYAEIMDALGISEETVYVWRDRLGLPHRREVENISWMDERSMNGFSPREILRKASQRTGFREVDIPGILMRFDKVPKSKFMPTQSKITLLLATAYEFLRWEHSGRQPMSANDFVKACNDAGLLLGKSKLLMAKRTLIDAHVFPPIPLSPSRLLDKKWYLLGPRLNPPLAVKTLAHSIISNTDLAGRAPESIVGGALAVAAKALSVSLPQESLARMLGTQEISIRQATKRIYAELEVAGVDLSQLATTAQVTING